MKRYLNVFRRPIILMLLMLLATGFLVHHALRVKEHIRQKIKATSMKLKADFKTGKAHSTIPLTDKTFDVKDIIKVRAESEKSKFLTKATVKETKQKPVDTTKQRTAQMEETQSLFSHIKTETKEVKLLNQKGLGYGKRENNTNAYINKQKSKDIALDVTYNRQSKNQSLNKNDTQSRPKQVHQPKNAENILKNQEVDSSDATNLIGAKAKQYNEKETTNEWALKATTNTSRSGSPVKYLIYLCDNKAPCYGLGDRQRAIVSTYYLACLTNRRFGIIMTTPYDIRAFYEPNLVDWDIKESELPANASKLEISALGPSVKLHLDKIDFNSVYPQDVIYIRTNQIFWFSTLKNPFYKGKVPSWARIHYSQLIPVGWLRLMQPTPLLRSALNSALNDIATKIREEAEVTKVLGQERCCKNFDLPRVVLSTCSIHKHQCSKNMTVQTCCDTMERKNFSGCPELRLQCSRIDFKACQNILSSTFPKRWDDQRAQTLVQNYCTMPPSISKLNISIESISTKTGFDLTDMNLVCAHIRLGRSKTFPFETHSFNNTRGISRVWDFLKTFAKKGYHIYLASDAQRVKDEARAIFGDRLHMADSEIVHIEHARKIRDKKAALQFTLMEQLLLTTSCREMLVSHSGYSGRAVEIRRKLMNGRAGKVYHLRNGLVT